MLRVPTPHRHKLELMEEEEEGKWSQGKAEDPDEDRDSLLPTLGPPPTVGRGGDGWPQALMGCRVLNPGHQAQEGAGHNARHTHSPRRTPAPL